MAWSDSEAAQYLLTLKQYESKTDGMLQGKAETKQVTK